MFRPQRCLARRARCRRVRHRRAGRADPQERPWLTAAARVAAGGNQQCLARSVPRLCRRATQHSRKPPTLRSPAITLPDPPASARPLSAEPQSEIPACPKPAVAPTGTSPNQKPFAELKVTGHLMTLDAGLFCIVQTPTARKAEDGSGLPGVRISLPPGPAGRPQSVAISSFRPDGYLHGQTDAALVRVTEGPAQVLVTVYQWRRSRHRAPVASAPAGRRRTGAIGPMAAPRDGGRARQRGARAGAAARAARHDRPCADPRRCRPGLGEWLGDRGSKRWIEGFAVAPPRRRTAGYRIPGGARTRLAVAVGRGRAVLRQPRHGSAVARAAVAAARRRGRDVRVRLFGDLHRRLGGRAGAGRRSLRGRKPGADGVVPRGRPFPCRGGCGARRRRAGAATELGVAAASASRNGARPRGPNRGRNQTHGRRQRQARSAVVVRGREPAKPRHPFRCEGKNRNPPPLPGRRLQRYEAP